MSLYARSVGIGTPSSAKIALDASRAWAVAALSSDRRRTSSEPFQGVRSFERIAPCLPGGRRLLEGGRRASVIPAHLGEQRPHARHGVLDPLHEDGPGPGERLGQLELAEQPADADRLGQLELPVFRRPVPCRVVELAQTLGRGRRIALHPGDHGGGDERRREDLEVADLPGRGEVSLHQSSGVVQLAAMPLDPRGVGQRGRPHLRISPCCAAHATARPARSSASSHRPAS